MDIVRVLKALGDETRLRIMHLLRREMLCVCEIEAVLSTSQSNISRHLAKLRDAELIYSEKKAQWVYYGIAEASLAQHKFIGILLAEDLLNHPEYQQDLATLRVLREQSPCRPFGHPASSE